LALSCLEAHPTAPAAEALASVLAAFPGAARAHAGGGRAAAWAGGALSAALTGSGDRMPSASSLELGCSAARVLALAPRTAPAGEGAAAAAWGEAGQGLLATAASALDTALAGSGEDGALVAAASSSLDPTAKASDAAAAAASQASTSSRAAALRRAGGAMDALERLLSAGSGSPGGAPLPGPGIVALVARIIGAPREGRGSPSKASNPPGAAPATLSAAALGLLTSFLRAAGGSAALAPTAAAAGRTLTDALSAIGASPADGAGRPSPAARPWRPHRAEEASVRAALYVAAAAVADTCGIATSLRLAPILIPLVWSDGVAWIGVAEVAPSSAATAAPTTGRKRKGRCVEEQQPSTTTPAAARAAARVGGDDKARRFSIAGAALDALQALLRTCGPALPSALRAKADMTASAAAARLETAAGSAASAATAAIMDTTRASALRALTTSLLSPNAHRPPHLPLALALLASAARVGGPTSAAVARDALLATEALLHARAVPPAGGAVGGEVLSLVPPGLWAPQGLFGGEEEEPASEDEEGGGMEVEVAVGALVVRAPSPPPAPAPPPPPPPPAAVVEAVVTGADAPAAVPVFAPVPAPAPVPAAPSPPAHQPAASGASLPSLDSGSENE